MEESKSNPEVENLQSFKQIPLKSTKYKTKYELVWSVKFIDCISSLTSRAFTNMIKKLKKDSEEWLNSISFGDKWLVTNKLHINFQESELQQKSNESHEDLIKEIEVSLLTQSLEERLLLDSHV